MRAAGVVAVLQLQFGYPVAAVVAAAGAILETAGGTPGSEIADAAVVAYSGGAKEQMPVANGWGLVRVDDGIERSCLGQRAALKPSRDGLVTRVC